MSTQNNNSNTDEGAAPAAQTRDEQKVAKKKQAVLEHKVDTAEEVLQMLIKYPQLWNRDEFREIRSKVNAIVTDPDTFPLSPRGWGTSRDCLTKGVANQLKNRSMTAQLEHRTDESAIYLQISKASRDTKNGTIGIDGSSTDITRQVWKFNAFDGDNNPLLFRIDSTLNGRAMTLASGTIAKVTTYFPVYFNYGNQKDIRCAIVVRSFEVVGWQPIPDIPTTVGTHGKAENIKSEKKAAAAKPKKRKKASTSTTQESVKPTCNGILCSKHGVTFGNLCLAELIPPKTVPLPLVARDCVFVTMDMNEMMNNNKRFLLYYYYATTVYQFHGSGNRVDLPECIIYAIRALYPKETIDVTNA